MGLHRLFAIAIYSKGLQLLGQGSDGIDRLMQTLCVIKTHIDVEHVLPLFAYDGE